MTDARPDPKLSVCDGLDHLADRLDPIIGAKFTTDLASNPSTVILNHLDQVAGKPPRTYTTADSRTPDIAAG